MFELTENGVPEVGRARQLGRETAARSFVNDLFSRGGSGTIPMSALSRGDLVNTSRRLDVTSPATVGDVVYLLSTGEQKEGNIATGEVALRAGTFELSRRKFDVSTNKKDGGPLELFAITEADSQVAVGFSVDLKGMDRLPFDYHMVVNGVVFKPVYKKEEGSTREGFAGFANADGKKGDLRSVKDLMKQYPEVFEQFGKALLAAKPDEGVSMNVVPRMEDLLNFLRNKGKVVQIKGVVAPPGR